MKRWLLPVVVLLVLTAGCIYVTAPGGQGTQGTPQTKGQSPTAYIDSITPTSTSAGESVNFAGHGTDPDGTVVGYKWRSSLSGDLSNSASFQTSSLTPGTHTIYFQVQDNQGNWSNEVTSTVTIAAAPPPTTLPPIVNSFYTTPSTILAGSPATLSWNVSNATSVTIDPGIGAVASVGSIPILPVTSTVYTITATNSLGSVLAATQIIVLSSLPPDMPVINSFFASPAVVVKGSSTTLSWSVSNAATVQIDQGIGTVNASGIKTITPSTSTAYTLIASNPSGWVSQTITVSVFTYIPGLKIDPGYFKIPIIPVGP
ncbi:MAG: hypothetical protein FJ008_07700 [Chloroflexi bacterium]|nr:hypothetical protein [Chloroflexota bacterium]